MTTSLHTDAPAPDPLDDQLPLTAEFDQKSVELFARLVAGARGGARAPASAC